MPRTLTGTVSGTVHVAIVYSIGLHELPPAIRRFMVKRCKWLRFSSLLGLLLARATRDNKPLDASPDVSGERVSHHDWSGNA
ncbi:MAG TPA: hypothetical protein VIF81_07440 [Pyrinomonadaceae bacterium]|jgi:hypothetical protein